MQILLVILGLLAGALIGWFWATTRAARQKQVQREQLLGQCQQERELRISAETRLEETYKQLEAQSNLVEEAKQQLGDTFKAISSDALQANSQAFVERARDTLKPVEDALKRYELQIQQIESERQRAYGGLSEQMARLTTTEQQLQQETANLVTALRRPEVRGRWGELTLRRTAELAGLSQYCDFEEQVTVAGDGGRFRPDMIVRLPSRREIVVDSKAPLEAFLNAVEAQDEQTRDACLERHCQQLRQHMNALAAKSYWDQFTAAPEFVVMFVPGESFLAAAVEKDPGLIEEALQKKVLLASPINLIAVLKAVAYGWRQEQLAENAQRVSQLGQDLYKRLRVFVGHLANVGKRLGAATEAYNAAVGSLEHSVLPGARRFTELGAAGGDAIPEFTPVDLQPRELPATEEEESAG